MDWAWCCGPVRSIVPSRAVLCNDDIYPRLTPSWTSSSRTYAYESAASFCPEEEPFTYTIYTNDHNLEHRSKEA